MCTLLLCLSCFSIDVECGHDYAKLVLKLKEHGSILWSCATYVDDIKKELLADYHFFLGDTQPKCAHYLDFLSIFPEFKHQPDRAHS